MRAIVYNPRAHLGLRHQEVPEPRPWAHQATIEVHAFSINFADVSFLERRTPGQVLGVDASGIVRQAAADGSGPAPGTRVAACGVNSGGWAELCAVDTDRLARVPDDMSLVDAAALATTGATVFRAIRKLGSLLGRRLLITGASGGVGRMAVQLAALSGAYVIAQVGSPERGAGLIDLGACEVVLDLKHLAPVHAVLETIGGSLLSNAYARLDPNGNLVSIGMASREPTSIDFEQARLRGGGRIEAFNVFAEPRLGEDIEQVLRLAAHGQLDPCIAWRGAWTDIAAAIDAFRSRQVNGKAVLEVRDEVSVS